MTTHPEKSTEAQTNATTASYSQSSLCMFAINELTSLNFMNGMMVLEHDKLTWGPNVNLDELALELKRLYEFYCGANK